MTAAKVDALRDSAADALDRAQGSVASGLKEGPRHAGVLLDQSGELLSSVSDQASESVAELAKGLIAYTRKNPLSALVVAVGVGALLVSLARSTQSRR